MKKKQIVKKALFFLGILAVSLSMATPSFAFDHTYGLWNQFLQRHVKDGLVDYKGILKNPRNFKKAVDALGSVTKDDYNVWTDDQKKAFWINAYNIGAVKHIIDNYPLKKSFGLSALRYPANSIQQIPDVWNKPVLNLLGKKVSLNYIENEVLRQDFEDPRVHFAIVCASIGCPVLRGDAYNADQLDSQLNDQIKEFVHTPDKFRYNASRDRLLLSPIFKWFEDDFEKKGGVINFLKNYVSQDIASKLSEKTRIEWQKYDWSLNERLIDGTP